MSSTIVIAWCQGVDSYCIARLSVRCSAKLCELVHASDKYYFSCVGEKHADEYTVACAIVNNWLHFTSCKCIHSLVNKH